MRIKDSPKSHAEGGSKKESKKKGAKQKAESNRTVIHNKTEKTSAVSKTEKERQKKAPTKDGLEKQVMRNVSVHTLILNYLDPNIPFICFLDS